MLIGNVQIDNNVFLAPMAGITDMAFRLLCKEKGCGFVYTEMVSAKGMHYNDKKSKMLTNFCITEMPVGVQIFGSDPVIMAEIAEQLDKTDISIIDINMGCPTPKITKNGEGAALMMKPKLAGEIVRSVANATSKPVTVKIRKGWDDNSINAVEIAKIAEDNGAKAVTIHGRTREQFYKGCADWEIIAKVKESLSIPVIGNGDIVKPADAKSMLEQTGCDAVMIGRGAQGNPWIFGRITEYLKSGEILPEPTFDEKIEMIIRHMNLLTELKGEKIGVLEMRKHIAWYIKGLKNATQVRQEVYNMSSKYDIVELLKAYKPI